MNKQESSMEKKKSNPILRIGAICLVALAVVSLIGELAYPRSAMMILTAFTRPSSNPQQFIPTNGQGGNFNKGGTGTPSNRIRAGTPQAGMPGQLQSNGQYGTNTNRQFGNRSSSPFSWLFPAALGLFVLLTITISIFLVKKKKWAAVLAIALAFLTLIVNAFAIYAEFGIARFMSMQNQGNFALTIIETILAIAVIVLLLLPKSRKLWAVNLPKPIIVDEDDDDDEFEHDADYSDQAFKTRPEGDSSASRPNAVPKIIENKSSSISRSDLKQSLPHSVHEEDDDDDE
jgi:uncharacterized membrane protein